MPVTPAMRPCYPPDWSSAVVPRIRARAKDRCERCGVPNGVFAVRETFMGSPIAGSWRAAGSRREAQRLKRHWEYSLLMMTGEMPVIRDPVEIVLAVAHGDDPSPENCDDANLWLACQCCHAQHDGPQRSQRIRLAKRVLN